MYPRGSALSRGRERDVAKGEPVTILGDARADPAYAVVLTVPTLPNGPLVVFLSE
jgi:hypothetical protein